MSLADNANPRGECWPSLSTIAARTCFGKTAVITAVRWLEDHGALKADRSNGRHTRYTVTPTTFARPASQTGAGAEPVRQVHRSGKHTGTAGEPNRSASRTAPVRQADTNHQEPPVTLNALSPARDASAAPGQVAAAMNRAGVRITSQHPDLIAACAEGVTAPQLLELQAAHPDKPAPYLIAIARRHVAEGAAPVTIGEPRHAASRTLSAVDRIAANVQRAQQRDASHDDSGIIEGQAVRVAR